MFTTRAPFASYTATAGLASTGARVAATAVGCCGACGQTLDRVDVEDLELSDAVHFRSPPPAPKCYELPCPRCGALLSVAERLGTVSPLLLHDAPGPSVVPRSAQGGLPG